ncbi:dipeptidyl-peptidase 5 [Beijerinckia mobilis]|uniref:dipeptidyl-peptidase 5 n=1 Tax=Beijerinckia mobilis TaxID=231434 RepID=UPI0005587314|nr:prolyl oligopeptidase family serine peptidase [Beijerinckia mobilis]
MTARLAPYGTWVSPVTTDLMTEAAVGLGGLTVDGSDVYWLETRPSEGGRATLLQRRRDGAIVERTPAPLYVGTRVHEYGGGAFAVQKGTIVFSDRRDGSVWLIEGEGAPRQIPTQPNCRYADFIFDPLHPRLLCIREDHRVTAAEPGVHVDTKATIVSLPLDASDKERVIVEGPDFLSSPRLSPDGKHLVFLSWDHPNMPWDWTRLHLAPMTLYGSITPAVILAGRDRESIVQPAFSPDGTLHFCSDRTGWWNLYVLRGDKILPVAPVEAEIGGPHWVFAQHYYAFLSDTRLIAAIVRNGIRTACIIENGTIEDLPLGQVLDCPQPLAFDDRVRGIGGGAEQELAFIATPPTAPPALKRAAHLHDSAPEILRVSAPPVIPEGSISIGEPIDYPSRGTIAHAFWYAPKNADYNAPEGTLPPLVVLSHGGPTSMTTNHFALAVQWWTSRGFGVVDVNYGGSTGYGRDYRRALDGQWGIVDVEDCRAAALHLAAKGLVDPQRLVIRGGSAGGFTTLAALTSTDTFKAGASLYGVADLMLLARDTHKFESRYLDGLVGPLPEAESLYAERSPINHIDRLACPVIFFQGEDDKTVPPNQAETMVAALEARHLPVAFYLFAGEGHGFRKAETQRRVLDLELGFYGRVFGFEPPGLSERVVIRDLPFPIS